MVRPAALVALLAVALSGAPAWALDVVGLDGGSVTLSAKDYAALPRTTLTIVQHNKRHTFQGPLLSNVLKFVNAPVGEALRGRELTDVVIVTATDGYQIVLALAETDPAVRKQKILLADKMDGAALGEKDGPYRLVVEGDLKPARAARMVARIELKRLAAPKP